MHNARSREGGFHGKRVRTTSTSLSQNWAGCQPVRLPPANCSRAICYPPKRGLSSSRPRISTIFMTAPTRATRIKSASAVARSHSNFACQLSLVGHGISLLPSILVGDPEGRAVLWTHPATVVERGRGDVGVAEPLLHLGNVCLVVEGVSGGHGAQGMRTKTAHHDPRCGGVMATTYLGRSNA